MDSRISSINLHYEFRTENINWSTNFDQFMQRFYLVHSKSVFDKVRYLSRRNYSLGFKKYKGNDFLGADFTYNSRSVNFENLRTNFWSKLYLSIKKGPLYLNFGYFRIKENLGLDYLFQIEKKLSIIDLLFENSLVNKLYHPNHVHMFSSLSLHDSYMTSSSKVSIRYLNAKIKLSCHIIYYLI